MGSWAPCSFHLQLSVTHMLSKEKVNPSVQHGGEQLTGSLYLGNLCPIFDELSCFLAYYQFPTHLLILIRAGFRTQPVLDSDIIFLLCYAFINLLSFLSLGTQHFVERQGQQYYFIPKFFNNILTLWSLLYTQLCPPQFPPYSTDPPRCRQSYFSQKQI